MRKQGERTVKLPVEQVEGGGRKEVSKLFNDFLIKFDNLADDSQIVPGIVPGEPNKTYTEIDFAEMHSNIVGVESTFLQLSRETAIRWKDCLQRNLYDDNLVLNHTVRYVPRSAGREQWRQLLIRVLEILHPGI